jgi:hypothetical protein
MSSIQECLFFNKGMYICLSTKVQRISLSFDKGYVYMLYADVTWKIFISLSIYKKVFVVSF